MKAHWHVASLVIVSSLLLWPAAAWTQTLGSGAIAGVVKDTTGAVLPGVTVEAASPALIEKVRTVVTDSQGLYRIVDLRPGLYTVTFTLPGFSTVKREGLELTANFTATVNVDLQVGSLEETISVSAESPVVDIQNVVQQKTFSREVLDTLPFGKSASSYASLIPGATLTNDRQDVGGINQGSRGFTIHGGTEDNRNLVAGISFDSPQERGANVGYHTNRASVQEVSIEVGGTSAEAETGGVQLHFVPKDGGNTFAVYFATEYGNGDMQNDNLTDALRSRGLPVPNKLKKAYDYSFGLAARGESLS
ncbi:MAG: carboxypeptidase regulatory-like domain-containing protein [Acidobacteria bacterium]|nr:carboxypeptidase regulatory-like domain-containing protein [Acidobacteriota bacterium]